ncbi:hypothetical protein TNCV_1777591 [Trichonephila clavipes]|nr:hypothetical protein TNCV_1777591 [Trichonephila clavipes]
MLVVENVTKGLRIRSFDSPSRNDSPFSPINISNKVNKFNEWVLFESETNFPENVPGDISFKSSSLIVFRQGIFEVTPSNFDRISMSSGLRINEC